MRSADGTLNTRTGATGKDKVLGVPLVKETYRSQKSLKTNRLRGRIENAKQIDRKSYSKRVFRVAMLFRNELDSLEVFLSPQLH